MLNFRIVWLRFVALGRQPFFGRQKWGTAVCKNFGLNVESDCVFILQWRFKYPCHTCSWRGKPQPWRKNAALLSYLIYSKQCRNVHSHSCRIYSRISDQISCNSLARRWRGNLVRGEAVRTDRQARTLCSKHVYGDWSYECAPNSANVLERHAILIGRSEVRLTATIYCRLQLFRALGRSDRKYVIWLLHYYVYKYSDTITTD